MTSASIDDLLGYEEETATPPGRSRRSIVLLTLLRTIVITGVVTLLLRGVGVAVPVVLVAAGVLALLALRRLLVLVAPPARRPGRRVSGEFDAGDGMYQWPSPDAMRWAVTRWEQRLAWYVDVPTTFTERLQPMLRDLADERLRQRHGVTIAGDPHRARMLLGEPLWTVLTSTRRRGPGLHELAAAVARLEDLAT